jgi:kynurenine formamidase
LIRRETDQKKFRGDADKAFSPLSKSYVDMMTVLIHRVKTDLSAEQVCFLQFSIPKFVLDSVTTALNSEIASTKKQAADLRNQGSMQVLKVQHQLAWMSKHYNSIVYGVKKQIFEHLHRSEYR